ncbi:hypothetical protein CLOM_g22790 [Closterium sp. NIES-68]|nr:hypothetical protein CLOM_g22790 [Closterium sp. NIES-68]GJP76526.1 hypothetical protein CLOP_g6957 [Closterium sp. NIES-67]
MIEEVEEVSILVESRNGDNAARQPATADGIVESITDVAGRPQGESDGAADSDDETACERGFAGDRQSSLQDTTSKPSDDTSADGDIGRNGLLYDTNSSMPMLCDPDNKVAGEASDDGGDDDSNSRKQFASSLSGISAASGGSGSGSGSGRGEDTDGKGKDIEAPIRVRRGDFDINHENHYVIVIHGTFDAPPADGAPTWYQPPAPGEQNFCRKLSRLLAGGPIGEDAIWRELPCSALPGIPYPFHWDGTNTHAGRVTAAMKLHNLIDQIAQNDPAARIHLVAHSHGGNVMLKTVELYMAKLGRRQKDEWHPAVAERFWVAHRRSYDLIKKWRKIDLRGSWWRFFPFLVVFRGFNGQKAVKVKEQYPWAYHQGLDSFLRLPAVRQRRFLAFRHATSPITNALGALVFLGTPFYIKKWQKNGLLWFAVSTMMSVVIMYIFIIAYTSFWQIIVLLIAGRPEDFYSRSGPHFFIATGIMLLVLVKQIMDAVGNTVFYSGNLYHNPAFDWSPAMSALVIHAGKLDEASLALSMEPITRAYVFPHLTKLLKQTPWAPFPKAPTRYARQVDWWAYLFNCTIILVWDTLFFLPAAIMSVLSHIVAPIVTGTIQKMVVTISFGLSPGDLNNAYIYVDEQLDLDLASQQVDQWNVQKLLAEAKTKSLKGELMPGYEDDTVEKPEWMEPVHPHPHPARSPLGSPRGTPGTPNEEGETATAEAAESSAAAFSRTGSALRKRRGFRDVVMRHAAASESSMMGGRGVRLSTLAAVAEAAAVEAAAVKAGEAEIPAAGNEWEGKEAGAVDAAAEAFEKKGVAGSDQSGPVPCRVSFEGKLSRSLTSDEKASLEKEEEAASAKAAAAVEKVEEASVEVPAAVSSAGATTAPATGAATTAATTGATAVFASVSGASDTAPSSAGVAASQESEDPQDQEREKLVYDFLWDDKELSLLAEQSQTFQRLKSQMATIGRNPRLSEREFERQLQQLCVMIEERMGELTGRFDLNHGAYFRDPRILRVIAHFIEKRELPEWSKGIDGDIWRWNEHLAKIQSMQLLQMAAGGAGEGGGLGGGTGGGDGSLAEEGKSNAARLKSLLKSIRGGSMREGRSSKSLSAHLGEISELAGGARGLAEGLLGSAGSFNSRSRSKAVSFSMQGVSLPNLHPEAIAAPVRKLGSSVRTTVASTVVSTVNATTQIADSVFSGRMPQQQRGVVGTGGQGNVQLITDGSSGGSNSEGASGTAVSHEGAGETKMSRTQTSEGEPVVQRSGEKEMHLMHRSLSASGI